MKQPGPQAWSSLQARQWWLPQLLATPHACPIPAGRDGHVKLPAHLPQPYARYPLVATLWIQARARNRNPSHIADNDLVLPPALRLRRGVSLDRFTGGLGDLRAKA